MFPPGIGSHGILLLALLLGPAWGRWCALAVGVTPGMFSFSFGCRVEGEPRSSITRNE